jgi:hypothetical protein
MAYQIYPSRYKDLEAVTIESEGIKAQFLPGAGAKLASLVYKPLNYELLVQRPGEVYLLQPFDGDYVAGECSGFDDMFPTIDACSYERFPWKGVPLADHGEVWSLLWDLTQEKDCLHFGVNGVRLPYRLEKQVRFDPTGALQIDYELVNPTPFAMDCLWAAHMMINLSEGCELVLPEGVHKVVNRLSFNGSLGGFGDEFDWPVCIGSDGKPRDLRWLRPKSAQDADKYFIKGKMPEGWCRLNYHAEKFSLQVSFPVETVPYLGILTNEMGFQNLYNIFIEPCTGSFDRIDLARLRGENSVVQPHASLHWRLLISIEPLRSAV